MEASTAVTIIVWCVSRRMSAAVAINGNSNHNGLHYHRDLCLNPYDNECILPMQYMYMQL